MDQNRVSLMLGLVMKRLTVRVGYMNRYLPNARGGDGLDEHAAIIWFTQRVDLSKRRLPNRGTKRVDNDDYPEYGGP